jgi:hypothetical protein
MGNPDDRPASETTLPPGRTAMVATSDPRDGSHNTLVLGGVDVIIPLEMDADGDPDSEDTVRLTAADGFYQAVRREGDTEITREDSGPVLLYRFPDVPAGTYAVEVQVGESWYTVLQDLRVTRAGKLFVGDEPFEGGPGPGEFGTPDEPEEAEEPVDEGEEAALRQDE